MIYYILKIIEKILNATLAYIFKFNEHKFVPKIINENL